MITVGTIPILDKAISLLGVVANEDSGNTVKRLSVATKIPIATCYRIVRTFVRHNWLQEQARGEFRLAFGIAHLARSYAEVERLLGLVEPILKGVAAATNLSAKISLREGRHAVTVLRAEPPRLNAITSPVGAKFSLTIGSAAAVLMSGLPGSEIERIIETAPEESWERQTAADVRCRVEEARAEGLSWEMGQQHPSIFAVSTAVSLSKELPAALSLVGWPDDFEGEKRPGIEKQLRVAAGQIRKVLGDGGR